MKLEQSSIVVAHCTVPLYFILNWFYPGHWEKALLETGITQVYALLDTYEHNNLRSFEQRRLSFGLPSAHFFQYLQVRDFIRVQPGGKLIPLEDSKIDRMMRDKHNFKGFLSYACNRLMSLAEK